MNKNLVYKIIAAFLIGLAAGLLIWKTGAIDVPSYEKYVAPFGQVLVSMLKMIVIPVILLSLIAGAASLPTDQFGKIGLKVIVWYFLTSLLAAATGSVLAVMFNPGGSDAAEWSKLMAEESVTKASQDVLSKSGGSLIDVLVGMFKNPFQALANGDFLAIIVFAIGFGLALKIVHDTTADTRIKNGIQNLLDLTDAAKEGIFKMVDWILLYTPIGVFALTSVNFAKYGSLLFGPYVMLTLGVILGVLTMMFIVYPVMMAVTIKKNPFKFLIAIQEAMLTAFVTRSSAATLPVSLTIAEDELKINSSLSSFALPLGSTINMDGVCVHLPMFAVLASNMFNVPLTLGHLTVLVLMTVLASVGAGGVPGGSLMLLFIILQNMQLQPDQIATIVGLALGINPILDMFETMNNVTGDLVCTYSVAEMTNMVEK